MSKQRLLLLLLTTGLLAGYIGWFIARYVDTTAEAVIVIHGQQQMALPPLPSGEEQVQEPSPTIVVAQCGVRKFKITTFTENGEEAKVRLSDLAPKQLQCLLEKGQQSIDGDAPERPLGPPPRRSYRPLYLSVEAN